MITETWHSEFNPSKFLSRVDLAQLIERNEAYNENLINDARISCILCEKVCASGILLNNRSFLCQNCYSEVAIISYPEKYETLHRQFLVAMEARRLAWEEFRKKFEYKSEESILIVIGWASIFFAYISSKFLILTLILLIIGYFEKFFNRQKLTEWLNLKSQWEQNNPLPNEPILKHFHDPTAELTSRDYKILTVFNHWPGYPPFWKYLRSVVISRDLYRCQVTGCPSRLELHVHHMLPVAEGGTHTPGNLVSLCSFHHALEPEKGHERIWGDIKTRYFTLVSHHERNNRINEGTHKVKAHLRRLELITIDELRELIKTYGFCCPGCGEVGIEFLLNSDKNIIRVECPTCQNATEGPQELAEETGPLLAEVLGVTRNKGRWRARWDMLSARKTAGWARWGSSSASLKRKPRKEKVEITKSDPVCPKCGSLMRVIKPHSNDRWKAFWGCTQYSITGCKGSLKFISKKK
ncbi:HNH endonuclease [Geothrix mesophila]|uniref:HNH endonuclease n=1 Tax=Geothrix mesophila TaxID=2922723 RepID=UPI001FACBAC7|nr:HNH endonuclease [Geothrix sp. SG198]